MGLVLGGDHRFSLGSGGDAKFGLQKGGSKFVSQAIKRRAGLGLTLRSGSDPIIGLWWLGGLD